MISIYYSFLNSNGKCYNLLYHQVLSNREVDNHMYRLSSQSDYHNIFSHGIIYTIPGVISRARIHIKNKRHYVKTVTKKNQRTVYKYQQMRGERIEVEND